MSCERNGLLCGWPQDDDDDDDEDLYHPTHQNEQGKFVIPPAGGWIVTTAAMTKSSWNDMPEDPRSVIFLQPSCSQLILQDPTSKMLYEHYVSKTANGCSGWQDDRNPFITQILSLAMSNDLVLQSVLALSGVHYCNNSSNETASLVTWTHYARAISGLKYGVTKHVTGVATDPLPLLAATLLLCFIEVRTSLFPCV